ncbi:hypothetical protein PQX77_009258 [Marasmius sp. AFHP31]|nr:hypothetical protein PQX77_009258 [Marasmius sp. AFHP31]
MNLAQEDSKDLDDLEDLSCRAERALEAEGFNTCKHTEVTTTTISTTQTTPVGGNGKTRKDFMRAMRNRCYGCGVTNHTKAHGNHGQEQCHHCKCFGHHMSVCQDESLGRMQGLGLKPARVVKINSAVPLMDVDKAPDSQWLVFKLVQEFYKEIYPAHPYRLYCHFPRRFCGIAPSHFILARHTCPAAVFYLSQSDPAQAFLSEPTALSEESYNELTRITPLVEKYAHSIMQVGFLSTVMAQIPEYSKAWCNKVFIDAVEEPFVPFTGRHHFDVLD